MSIIGDAREGQERGRGVPLTDEERELRHYEEHGDYDVPQQRGAGLQGIKNPLGSLSFSSIPWWAWLLAGALAVGYAWFRWQKHAKTGKK